MIFYRGNATKWPKHFNQSDLLNIRPRIFFNFSSVKIYSQFVVFDKKCTVSLYHKKIYNLFLLWNIYEVNKLFELDKSGNWINET